MATNKPGRSLDLCAPDKELVRVLRSVSGRYNLFDVFRDFVTMAACAISNSMDKKNYEEREALYMKTVSKYTKDEADMMTKALCIVTLALEVGPQDFLGNVFMALDLGDAWKGQFFTPFEVAKLMSMVTLSDAPAIIERDGFITVNDCCVGAGSMVIAAADVLRAQGINYQKHMHTIAGDIDPIAVYMTYIQTSLLGMPAVIYHGNSLSMEIWSEWRTPMHFIGAWESKLSKGGEKTRTEIQEISHIEVPKPEPIQVRQSAIKLRGEQIGFEFG